LLTNKGDKILSVETLCGKLLLLHINGVSEARQICSISGQRHTTISASSGHLPSRSICLEGKKCRKSSMEAWSYHTYMANKNMGNNYQNNRIAGSKGKNISTRDNPRTRSLKLCLGIVNDLKSSQRTVGCGCFLGVGPVNKHRSVAALNEAVMKMHPQQSGSDCGIGPEMSLNRGADNGFGSRACGSIEPDACGLGIRKRGTQAEQEKRQKECSARKSTTFHF
jgi:hypothetical protein